MDFWDIVYKIWDFGYCFLGKIGILFWYDEQNGSYAGGLAVIAAWGLRRSLDLVWLWVDWDEKGEAYAAG